MKRYNAEPMSEDTPRPGSLEAVADGCKCAVIDNHHGEGYGGQAGIYMMTAGCPLHLPETTT